MKISIVAELTKKTLKFLKILNDVERHLNIRAQTLDTKIKKVILGISFKDDLEVPLFQSVEEIFSTSELVLEIQLPLKKYLNLKNNEFNSSIIEDLRTVSKELSQADPRLGTYLSSCFAHDEKSTIDYKTKKDLSEIMPLAEDDFWNLMNTARAGAASGKHIVDRLIAEVQGLDETNIYAFGHALKHMLDRLKSDALIQHLVINYGFMSEDLYLSYRCNILLLGESIYKSVVGNDVSVLKGLKLSADSEDLINIVDDVLKIKKGIDRTKINIIDYELIDNLGDVSPLPLNEFWSLIHQVYLTDTSHTVMVKRLENKLKGLEDGSIYGFELTLVQVLNGLEKEVLLNYLVNSYGFISDDLFLYYRCSILLLGESVYSSIVNNDVSVLKEYLLHTDAEGLLYGTDNAIKIKYGDKYKLELPSNYAKRLLC